MMKYVDFHALASQALEVSKDNFLAMSVWHIPSAVDESVSTFISGNLCEIEIDECVGNPCANGGTCVDLVNGYRCSCTPEYMGKNCTEAYNACADSPCQNGGSCITSPAVMPGYYCECVNGKTY